MSLFSSNPANQLSDDALLVIFDNLDDQDLLRCETVCRQWRKVHFLWAFIDIIEQIYQNVAQKCPVTRPLPPSYE